MKEGGGVLLVRMLQPRMCQDTRQAHAVLPTKPLPFQPNYLQLKSQPLLYVLLLSTGCP